jgi:hypothetical protein
MLRSSFKDKITILLDNEDDINLIKELNQSEINSFEYIWILYGIVYYKESDFKILNDIELSNDLLNKLFQYVFEKGLEEEKAYYFLNRMSNITVESMINFLYESCEYLGFKEMSKILKNIINDKSFKIIKNSEEMNKILLICNEFPELKKIFELKIIDKKIKEF